eukprot:1058717-Lingulodinium_polyedra.AAC.1
MHLSAASPRWEREYNRAWQQQREMQTRQTAHPRRSRVRPRGAAARVLGAVRAGDAGGTHRDT